ncbi:MAG: hypothetical protein KAQ96_04645, partial [Thermoplasmata archaeon]|nr:hypothetical protein [Thermoplasmata archaeon]
MALGPDCELLYSTFFGGSDADYIRALELTDKGEVMIAGLTPSLDFCYTDDAYCSTIPSGSNPYGQFVSILDPTLSSLEYSTLIGEPNGMSFGDIAYNDDERIVYVAGVVSSTKDLNVTKGAFDWKGRGYFEFYVIGIDIDNSSISYRTYLGGEQNESWVTQSKALTIDGDGNLYLTSITESELFPTTTGAFQRNNKGSMDVIVLKMDPSPCGLRPPPTGVTNSSLDGRVLLVWNALGTMGCRYDQIVLKSTSSNFSTAEEIARVDWTENDYMDEAVENGEEYYYWIVIENSAGRSGPSEMEVGMPHGTPSEPYGLYAETGDRTVSLNWTVPNETGGRISKYLIFRVDP